MPKRVRDHREALVEDLRNDPEFAAHYLTAALEESNAVFLRALRDVAEAHRMAVVAQGAGLSREGLYRTLSETGNPRLSSLIGVFDAMGLKVIIESREVRPAAKEDTRSKTRRGRGNRRDRGTTGKPR